MKKLLLSAFSIFGILINSQTFNQNYANISNQVSQTNINTYLQEFQNLGVKTTGSTANNNAFEWLKTKYTSFGYNAEQISQDDFIYNGKTTSNLIITKKGDKFPNTYVIVCGHYDTANGPGANDNGSGVSVILEMARLLKDIPTEYSIKFINFSGEEQGLLGSQHYVSNVVNATNPKMDIRLVLNIDEVGGVKGKTNDTVTCERDTSAPNSNNATSNTYTQQLMTCVSLYSPLKTRLSNAYASDYMPFQSNGEIITGLFESNETTYAHSSTDTVANLDTVYIYNIAKAATGAVQHFSIAYNLLSVGDITSLEKHFNIFPNPAKDFIEITPVGNVNNYSFTVSNLDGKLISRTENISKININHLTKGVYIGTIKVGDKTISKKFIKE